MIRIIRNSSPLVIGLCMLMVMQLVCCGEDADDDDVDVSEAPPLPPDASMVVDLSTFDETVPGAPGAASTVSYKNFRNAATRVSAIGSALIAAATVPAAVFTAARLNEPTSEGDNTWVWSYSVTVDYITFTAALTGIQNSDKSIDWSMVMSADAPLRPVQDFVWYTGTSNVTNLEGSWQFYDMTTPTEQNPTITIDWTASEDDGKAKLTVENVDTRADSEYAGDVLDYDATENDAAVLSYEDSSEGEVWDITWNLDTGEGSLKVPEYNNGEKACWDANKQDAECE